MFNHLASEASVPVVAHLDHGYTEEECKEAIDCGFTSVMFDGSRLSLQENIDRTARIAELAHEADISCEGEFGFVGYSDGENQTARIHQKQKYLQKIQKSTQWPYPLETFIYKDIKRVTWTWRRSGK